MLRSVTPAAELEAQRRATTTHRARCTAHSPLIIILVIESRTARYPQRE
jgi:hypothetical protein